MQAQGSNGREVHPGTNWRVPVESIRLLRGVVKWRFSVRNLLLSASRRPFPTSSNRLQYDGCMTQGCRKCWPILVFNMSKTWKGDQCYSACVEKSTSCCASASARQLHRYCHLYLLSSFTRRAIPSRPPTSTFIRSYNEDSTLSRRTVGMPEADEFKDMTRLLASLWEAAQRLPEGSERQDAFRQIGSFQRRVAALITRPLGSQGCRVGLRSNSRRKIAI